MEKPGIERAIPGAAIGIAIGLAFVPFIRSVSGITPIWDNGLAMVIAPFTMMVGWLWGIGAFNPKNSEHAHPPYLHDGEEHGETAIVEVHHEEEVVAPTPGAILMRETWKALTYPLLLFFVFLGFAAIPDGFFLQTANDPTANVLAFGEGYTLALPFALPLIGDTLVLSEITMFILMILAVIVPLALMAGAIGFFMFMGHQQVAVTSKIAPTPQELTPPAPVRALGRGAKGLAAALRKGLPRFFGMK
jgi:hypothetical protein